MLSIRPKVAEHSLFLLGRSVHPELFQIYRSRASQRSNYQVRLDITSDGHVVTFHSGSVTMAEVVCSATQALPTRRRLIAQIFRQRSMQAVEVRRNVCYQTNFEMEQVTADVFWMIHEQLRHSSEEQSLCQVFNSSGRIPMGAVSYLHIQERQNHVVIRSIHTFPDDYLLLKSYTTFSIDPAA